MCEVEKVDAHDAVHEARDCCDRIASVLAATIVEAERLDDQDMLDRLAVAKAAADHARELIGRLAEMLETEQSSKAQHASD